MLPSRAPLLIVPIRDRRQSRRILTIRNCAVSMLAVAIVIASISLYNGRHGAAQPYGRLFGTQVAVQGERPVRNIDVISEGTVADQAAPEPMIVLPAEHQQLLTANANVPVPSIPAPAPPAAVTEGHGTTIVGDGKGVTIVQAPSTTTAPQPVLSGGIFKGQ